MNKKLNYVIYILSFFYLALNFSKIISTFKSSLWSIELDLMNHVSNLNFQMHLIALVLIFIVGNLSLSHWLGIHISKWILIPIILIIIVLLINSQIDFIRWMEINIFGGAGLALFALIFIMQMGWRMSRKGKV